MAPVRPARLAPPSCRTDHCGRPAPGGLRRAAAGGTRGPGRRSGPTRCGGGPVVPPERSRRRSRIGFPRPRARGPRRVDTSGHRPRTGADASGRLTAPGRRRSLTRVRPLAARRHVGGVGCRHARAHAVVERARPRRDGRSVLAPPVLGPEPTGSGRVCGQRHRGPQARAVPAPGSRHPAPPGPRQSGTEALSRPLGHRALRARRSGLGAQADRIGSRRTANAPSTRRTWHRTSPHRAPGTLLRRGAGRDREPGGRPAAGRRNRTGAGRPGRRRRLARRAPPHHPCRLLRRPAESWRARPHTVCRAGGRRGAPGTPRTCWSAGTCSGHGGCPGSAE
jgi:hypothetical protein